MFHIKTEYDIKIEHNEMETNNLITDHDYCLPSMNELWYN